MWLSRLCAGPNLLSRQYPFRGRIAIAGVQVQPEPTFTPKSIAAFSNEYEY
jgi:hypothetical protein